jgi:hypothetical protein
VKLILDVGEIDPATKIPLIEISRGGYRRTDRSDVFRAKNSNDVVVYVVEKGDEDAKERHLD